MGLFSYHCNWCDKDFDSNEVTKVDKPDEVQSDVLKSIGKDKPKFSLRKLSHYVCKNCAAKYYQDMRRIDNAYNNFDEVELVSSNYHGQKPHDKSTKIKISTIWVKDYSYGKRLLRTIAGYYGRNLVLDVEQSRDVDEEPSDSGKGVHKFTIYKYTGFAYSKKQQ